MGWPGGFGSDLRREGGVGGVKKEGQVSGEREDLPPEVGQAAMSHLSPVCLGQEPAIVCQPVRSGSCSPEY